MASKVRPVDSGIAALFQAETGDVHRHVEQLGRRIVFLSRRKVGVRTGATRASINFRLLNVPNGVVLEVTATSKAALMHHHGTRPHVILPRHGRALRFKSGGMVVYAKRVLHPGTRANPYLVMALREVVK